MDATRDFILSHRDGDIRRLALQAARFPEVDMPWALQQIAGWQVAQQKVPLWAANDGVEYPPHLSLEQCSSQATAEYKASVACRLLSQRRRMADLTGGMGVDCAFLARHFQQAVYVERQPELCQLAKHNFAALHLPHLQVVNATAEEYLPNLEKSLCSTSTPHAVHHREQEPMPLPTAHPIFYR